MFSYKEQRHALTTIDWYFYLLKFYNLATLFSEVSFNQIRLNRYFLVAVEVFETSPQAYEANVYTL